MYKKILVSLCIPVKGTSIWIQERMTQDQFQGKWEFPGGKVNSDEDPQDCCKREFKEETGLEVSSLKFFHTYFWKYEKMNIEFFLYLANVKMDSCSGKWIDIKEALSNSHYFPEANHQMLNDLKDYLETYAKRGISPV